MRWASNLARIENLTCAKKAVHLTWTRPVMHPVDNAETTPTPGVRLQLRLPPPQPRRASGRTRPSRTRAYCSTASENSGWTSAPCPSRTRAYCSRNSRPTSVNVKQQIANSRPLKRNWPRAGTFEALIKKQIPPGGLVPYRWRMAGRRGGCGRHGPPVLERAISTGFLPDASERSARTCQGADKGLPSVPAVDGWRSPSFVHARA